MNREPRDNKTLIDSRIDGKIVLAGLWTALMLLYVYCDIFSFYRPGQIAKIGSGTMGVIAVTQGSLLAASAMMIVPALMIAASLMMGAKANRIANVIFGTLYFLVDVGNLIGEAWAYYWLFGIFELLVCAGIVWTAIRWPRIGSISKTESIAPNPGASP